MPTNPKVSIIRKGKLFGTKSYAAMWMMGNKLISRVFVYKSSSVV